MVQEQAILNAADNSDACHVICIKILDSSYRRYVSVGDIIKITIKGAIPRGRVKKGDVLKMVMVRVKKGVHRPNGSVIHFDGNTCVILNDSSEQPIGARTFEPVARELHNEKFTKIISLVPEMLQGANHGGKDLS